MRTMIGVTILAASGAVAACPPRILTDTTFLNSDWTGQVVYDSTRTQNASFTAFQTVYDGAHGPSRQTNHSWCGQNVSGSQGMVVFHRRAAWTHDPSLQGPVASISYTLDANAYSAPSTNAVGYGLAIEQNGSVYVNSGVAFHGAGWTTIARTGLGPVNFGRVSGPGPATPDFSAAGSPMTFGYYTSNGTGYDGCFGTSSVADNLALTITPCAADVNCDGSIDDFDYFDFLNAFFADSMAADFNGDTSVDDFDYFDFLNAFFGGC
ncbi:MAG: hypothetical protein JNM07_13890 [Phycisphaerae bacterium]|nr:hypothetical protein [Phycisphaerae bacterium]